MTNRTSVRTCLENSVLLETGVGSVTSVIRHIPGTKRKPSALLFTESQPDRFGRCLENRWPSERRVGIETSALRHAFAMDQ